MTNRKKEVWFVIVLFVLTIILVKLVAWYLSVHPTDTYDWIMLPLLGFFWVVLLVFHIRRVIRR